MKKVPITELEAGEVVARPVTTANGLLLVQPGAVLTAELIDRFVNLGIDVVWIEGAGPDARPMSALLEELDQRFVGHEQDALMLELKAIIARSLQQGEAEHRD